MTQRTTTERPAKPYCVFTFDSINLQVVELHLKSACKDRLESRWVSVFAVMTFNFMTSSVVSCGHLLATACFKGALCWLHFFFLIIWREKSSLIELKKVFRLISAAFCISLCLCPHLEPEHVIYASYWFFSIYGRTEEIWEVFVRFVSSNLQFHLMFLLKLVKKQIKSNIASVAVVPAHILTRHSEHRWDW